MKKYNNTIQTTKQHPTNSIFKLTFVWFTSILAQCLDKNQVFTAFQKTDGMEYSKSQRGNCSK